MVPRELRLHEVHEHLETLWPGFTQYLQASYVYTYHPGAIPVWPPGRSPLVLKLRLVAGSKSARSSVTIRRG